MFLCFTRFLKQLICAIYAKFSSDCDVWFKINYESSFVSDKFHHEKRGKISLFCKDILNSYMSHGVPDIVCFVPHIEILNTVLYEQSCTLQRTCGNQ